MRIEDVPESRNGWGYPRPLEGDGGGWAFCDLGHKHWGLHGAAGVLVTDTTGPSHRVLLQHRAVWTHEGGTWAVPGGARDSHEDVLTTALREASEETTLLASDLTPYAEWVDDHGGWSYTTVLARADSGLDPAPANPETEAIGWWDVDAVAGLPLHAGFAAAWPHLQRLIT